MPGGLSIDINNSDTLYAFNPTTGEPMSNEGVASFLSATGWLTVILSAITAITLLTMPGFSKFMAFACFFAGTTSGIAVVGFGRIILLLSQIQASLQIRNSTVISNHQPGTLPSVNLWEKSQTDANKPSRDPYTPQPENRWFIHRGRRVEITREGPALVDGQKFDDAEAAKAFLDDKYPDRT
ncbi:hypothetical protein [Niveispirillum sp.]|uniref:hypothetical protein n=1 Tax=Niveispirillum sp. TaxID=1917217 RepID=UPI001B6DDFB5|nr:hypothetical protein [Niveispirillum sp.]MBP7339086.1 hypothetical protein [Niveispirillum sp.]